MANEFEAVPGTTAASAASSDDEYTLEVLQQMRKLGIAKPLAVSEMAWENATPPRQSIRDVRHALMKDLTNLPATPGDKSAYGKIFAYAIDTLLEIMGDNNQSGRTRLQAAMYVADQHSGKAEQHITHSGNIQHEFRQAASELEARYMQLTEASTAEAKLDNAVSLIDAFLESNVGADFSVGKRGTSGEESES